MQISLADPEAEIDPHREYTGEKQEVGECPPAVAQGTQKTVPAPQQKSQQDPPEKSPGGDSGRDHPINRRSQEPAGRACS